MASYETYSPSWPDLTGWTQDPHNGSITPGVNSVLLAVPNGQDADWSASIKLPVMLRLPLASLGLSSIDTLLVIDTVLSSYGGTLHNYNLIGVGFYEDDQNFIVGNITTGTPNAQGSRAISNVFAGSGVTIAKSGAPLRFVMAWNNGLTSAVLADPSVTLAPGEVAGFISDDGGTSWTTVWPAAAMPVAPTEMVLWLHNYTLQLYDVTATFEALTVGAPLLLFTDIVTTTSVSDVIPISKDLIKVEFSGAIAVSDQVLDPTSYQLSPEIAAVEVLPIEDPTTTEVYLRISPKATFDTIYSLTIPSAGTVTPLPPGDIPATAFYTPAEAPLQTMTGSWLHHKTKVDSLRSNMSQMYNTSVGSNMFHILAALGISDEEIGGDF